MGPQSCVALLCLSSALVGASWASTCYFFEELCIRHTCHVLPNPGERAENRYRSLVLGHTILWEAKFLLHEKLNQNSKTMRGWHRGPGSTEGS
jgi:hypothetical protein